MPDTAHPTGSRDPLRAIRQRLDDLVQIRTMGGWTAEEEAEYDQLSGDEARLL